MSQSPQLPGHAPMTEQEIHAAHVGEPDVLAGPVVLADYDPDWPRLFDRESTRIRAILDDRVLRLEHVGSTSVPGLAAKPVIDMLLVLENSADEAAYVPDMETAGYALLIREPAWFEHRVFKGPDTNINLHVLPAGCPEIHRMIAFRDLLRTNPEDRDLYERAKRDLAAKEWKYVQNYADAKTAVVEGIIARG
jgi:GrpB-like predicted nucleotidyltransferase (UPF0157 family)